MNESGESNVNINSTGSGTTKSARRRIMGAVAALVGAVTFTSGVAASPAHAQTPPKFEVKGSVVVTDHESFGPNEKAGGNFGWATWNSTIADDGTGWKSPCAGGEAYARVTGFATTGNVPASYPAGTVRVHYMFGLYEGTSCSTWDLDGKVTYAFYVLPNTTVWKYFTVHNTDEGGDYAQFAFMVKNNQV